MLNYLTVSDKQLSTINCEWCVRRMPMRITPRLKQKRLALLDTVGRPAYRDVFESSMNIPFTQISPIGRRSIKRPLVNQLYADEDNA